MDRINLHRRWETELCVIGAESRDALAARLAELDAFLASSEVDLADVAYTLSRSWRPGATTLSVVASSIDELRKKLAVSRERLADPARKRIRDRSGIFFFDGDARVEGKLAFLFPGEGSQYDNMLKDLCLHFPEARHAFDLVDRGCEGEGGFVPSALIFPAPGVAASDASLWEMAAAIESVSAAGLAIRSVVEKLGIVPDAVVGHSSGEFVALETAGVLCLDSDEKKVAFIRDGYAQLKALAERSNVREGVLLTVGGVDPVAIEAMLARHKGRVLVAIDNCPHQYVLCCEPAVADGIGAELSREGALVSALPFRRPYHTPWFEDTLDGLRSLFATHRPGPPRVPIYSCATADRFPDEVDAVTELCVTQWARPVRFRETVERMYANGIRVFMELGPRGNLTSFVDDILKGRSYLAVAADRMRRPTLAQLQYALGEMAAHGVAMDLSALYGGRRVEELDLAAPVRKWKAGGKAVMTLSPIFLPAMSAADIEPVETASPGRLRPADADTAVSETGDPVVAAYFDTMERFLAAQREVTGRFLGRTAPAPGPPPVPPAAVAPGMSGGAKPDIDGRPMLGEVVKYVPGQSLALLRTYDIGRDVFLKDHAFPGSVVSLQDSTLSGLPVMPLTMSLETVGEAASALVPGKVVVGVRDIRATRWISFEEGTRTVSISARVLSAGEETAVRVEIRDGDASDERAALRPPFVEATALLRDDYIAQRDAAPLALRGEKPCDWRTASIYPEFLFHGPSLQGISSMTRWGEDGVEGTLRVMPRSGFFTGNREPRFAFDGVLLDSAGAMLYLWCDCEGPLRRRAVVLPFRTREIRFYQPPPTPETVLKVTLKIVDHNDLSASSDIRVVDDEGQLVMELCEWEARVFRVSPPVHGVFHVPTASHISDVHTVPAGMALGDDLDICVCSSVTMDFMKSSHGVWQSMLAYSVFDGEDREAWRKMPGEAEERIAWLLGQAAGKDAVRRHLQREHGLRVASPDIGLLGAAAGTIIVNGQWQDADHPAPAIGIAWARDIAVGAAGKADAGRIGVAVDDGIAPSGAAGRAFLSEADQQVLAAADGDLWPQRAVCAKRAALQALGRASAADAQALRVVGVDAGSGVVRLAVGGAGAAGQPDSPRSLSVLTATCRQTAFAVARF